MRKKKHQTVVSVRKEREQLKLQKINKLQTQPKRKCGKLIHVVHDVVGYPLEKWTSFRAVSDSEVGISCNAAFFAAHGVPLP